MGSEAGGLETAPSLMAMVHAWGLLRRPQHEKGSNRKEHELSPLPSSSILSYLCRIASSSLCHFTLLLPGWGLCIFSPNSAVSHLLAGTTLSCYLFPSSLQAPHFLPPARRFPRGFLLCLSTLQSGSPQQCSFIICMPNPSMSTSPR